MEMCACKHGMGYWVCFDVCKLEAAAPWPLTSRLLMLGASREARSRSDGVGLGFDRDTPTPYSAEGRGERRATSRLRVTRSAPIDSS
jgi:hypothetical protein